jgi:hypothetical protein
MASHCFVLPCSIPVFNDFFMIFNLLLVLIWLWLVLCRTVRYTDTHMYIYFVINTKEFFS